MKHILLIFLSMLLKSDFVISDNLKGVIWFDSLHPGLFISGDSSVEIKIINSGNKIIKTYDEDSFCVTEYNELGQLVLAYTGNTIKKQ